MIRRLAATVLVVFLIVSGQQLGKAADCHTEPGTGEFIPIAVPGGTDTRALGINERGDVVGGYVDELTFQYEAFLLRNGEYYTLQLPGCDSPVATDINASGRIVGDCNDDMTHIRVVFVWDRGRVTKLPAPGAFWPVINASGTIAGSYVYPTDPDDLVHGFVYESGRFTVLDYPGAEQTVVRDVDARGNLLVEAVLPEGSRYFIKSRRGYEPLSLCTDLGEAQPRGLSPDGDLFGWSMSLAAGFVYSNGTSTLIQYANSSSTILFGGNTAGYVVGEAYIPADLRFVSFLYIPPPTGRR